MRLSWARQAAITGLVAVAMADVLPPDDIPLMCVTICGPIVELTAKCDVHHHRLAKRQPNPEWVPKLAVEPLEDDGLHKRSFSIIRAAPTSFPPQFEPQESTTSSTSTSTSTSTTKSTPASMKWVADDTSAEEQTMTMRRTLMSSSFVSSAVTQPTKTLQGDSGTASMTSWGASLQTQSLVPEDDPERECVCNNKSFDVAKIAALCQDCIVVDGHKQNNLDIIMQSCGFKPLTYTPDQDKAADNVRVEATRPTAMGAKQDSTNAGAELESGGNWVIIFTSLLGIALAV
ncbi:hypothetical protein FOPG_11826 [Fusarium oxysporum f. sp. conglutinans race 2 54008]|nr:hypothetical protein FOPG_11826 [Fusarium oxysporum f. sp. conglutinans race 2 54008]KAG6994282.1 hypothetical protein FocnCong_v016939 [Fusarium oxysporum f. sp. conglutinans]KAI8407198.1 hypothetical protein FOFC_12633 [Fusarium oxysporum]